MLKINDICKTFNKGTVNEKVAISHLSLQLNDGDFVTVIGSNGAGKSTLLNAIAGSWLTDSGSIFIDDADITRMEEFRRAKYIGRVFQDPLMGTAPDMQIEENLALALRRGEKRRLGPGITRKERELFFQLLRRDLVRKFFARPDRPVIRRPAAGSYPVNGYPEKA